jgi:ATP-binding cassette subfamily F protein uup
VVSHDRYFLDRTVDVIFAFEAGGNLRQYPGNYSVYLDYKAAKETEEKETKKPKEVSESKNQKSKTENPKSNQPRKLSFNEKREYEELENKIPEMEAQKEAVEKILYNNPPSDFNELQKLTDKLAQLTEAIDSATERWLELAERLG